MKKILALLSALFLLLSLAACGGGAGGDPGGSDSGGQSGAGQISQSAEPEINGSDPLDGAEDEEEPTVLKLEISAGERTFSATLYDNAAARTLLELLPMTLDMSELNGNEKYHYLDTTLPTDPGRPAGIRTGDIMLYGDSCLVLFYQSFSTTYSYTVLGRVDDPEELAAAVGSGDIEVSFRKTG